MNGIFSWTDGTSWDYSNWAYGKPDNHHGTENCVNMYANIHVQNGTMGQWNDFPCKDHRSRFVCSKSIGSAITTSSSNLPSTTTTITNATTATTTTTKSMNGEKNLSNP